MSSPFFINEKKYHKIKFASQQVGYSTDYVTRLARDKKIVAVQLERKWYVSLESLQQYVEIQKIEQQARQSQLRKVRQHEIALHTASQEVSRKGTSLAETGYVFAAGAAASLLLVGSVVGLQFSSLVGQAAQPAAVVLSSATHSAEKSTDLVLDPVFIDEAIVRVADDRVVRRPDVTTDWLFIAYE